MDRAQTTPAEWQPMSAVPLIEDQSVLLLTNTGVVEARYSPGQWSEDREGASYDGPVWVCCDDTFQIEIEEIGEDPIEWHHGSAVGWLPRSVLPIAPESV